MTKRRALLLRHRGHEQPHARLSEHFRHSPCYRVKRALKQPPLPSPMPPPSSRRLAAASSELLLFQPCCIPRRTPSPLLGLLIMLLLLLVSESPVWRCSCIMAETLCFPRVSFFYFFSSVFRFRSEYERHESGEGRGAGGGHIVSMKFPYRKLSGGWVAACMHAHCWGLEHMKQQGYLLIT